MQRVLGCLGLCAVLAASLAAGEPTKEKVRGTVLVPEPAALKPGGGLSVRTAVTRPRALKGVRSWTVETRRHRWAALTMALSPDGSMLATSGYDGMIRVWDPATGKLLRILVGHDSYVLGLAWSTDGRYLASAGSFDLTVRIWEGGTGLPVKVFKDLKEAPTVVAWSPDGALLAAGTIESGYVSVWRTAEGRLVKTVSSGKGVVSLAFNPDGERLACGVSQVGVVVRKGPDWGVDGQIEFKGEEVRSLIYNPSGKQLLAGTARQVMVWDPAAKKVVQRLEAGALAAAWSKNLLAVVSPAGQVWDLAAGKATGTLPTGQAVAWDRDGKRVFILSGDDVIVGDPARGMEVKRWSVAATGALLWQPNRAMLSGLGTAKPRLWDQTTGKPLLTLESSAAGTTVAAWSPGGKVLTTGGPDKVVRVVEPVTGKVTHRLLCDAGVTALAVASDGKVAAGSADGKVRVFGANGSKVLKTFTGQTGAVKVLAWSREGKLASGGLDPAVYLWGMESAKSAQMLEHPGSVESLAFAVNGKQLAAGASEDRVHLWSYPGRKLLHELSSPGSPPAVSALAYSPDSTLLLAGRANHTLQLWDAKLGKLRHSVGTMAPVQSVAWAAGGRVMVTCTIDRCVRFYSPVNGQLQATAVAEDGQVSCISAEGHYRIANEAETELVCVVLTARGMQAYSPKEFAVKFGWKNNPARASLKGN